MLSDTPSSVVKDKEPVHIPKIIRIRALNGSARKVYYSLSKKPQKVTDLEKSTNYSTRTIRYALKRLKKAGLVSQIPDMEDLRSHKYKIV